LLRVELQKKEAAPRVDRDGIEGEVFFAEIVGIFEEWSAEKFAVEVVGLLVVGAADGILCDGGGEGDVPASVGRLRVLRGFAEAGATVAADVVMGSELAGWSADDKDAFVGDFEDGMIAGCGEVFFATGAEPFGREDEGLFAGEEFGGGVVGAGERFLHLRPVENRRGGKRKARPTLRR
jgi:hypothetical protein